MSDCVFCRIVAGEIPATLVREDDATLAFRDLDPKAPVHVLVIPKRHIASVAEADAADAPLLGRLVTAAAEIARAEGEAAVRALVREAVAAGAGDVGTVMSQVMPRLKGRFDGREANRIVREELG